MKEYLYSRNAVYEALRARRRHFFRLLLADSVQPTDRIGEILQLAAALKLPVERAPRARLDQIHPASQGIALEAGGYPSSSLAEIMALARKRAEPPFLLLLDTLQDPQNLGTLLRTAEAVGVHGAVIPLARAAEVTPAVVNASSGASEHLLIAQANLAQTIEQLKAADVWVIGLEGSPQAQPVERVKLDGPLALVVGSEGEGMRPLVRKSCDVLLRLPMRGQVASLNAAVAGSVALYLAYQQRMQP